jgi:pilin isopeptide linkage protein/uncharacterized repeat protein (TIGR01451 family)
MDATGKAESAIAGNNILRVNAVRMVDDTGPGGVNEIKNGIYPIGIRSLIGKSAETPQSSIGAIGKIGDTITYTIDYLNTSSSAVDVVITDTVPAHTTYVAYGSPTTAPAVGAPPGSVIAWKISSVPPGTGDSVSFRVRVSPSALNAVIANTASVQSGDGVPLQTNEVRTSIPGIAVTAPAITKHLDGNALSAPRRFDFSLAGRDGNEPLPPVTGAAVTGAGVATPSLGTISFIEPGAYTYYLSETSGSAVGYTYDKHVYVWTVTITTGASIGSLSASAILKVKEDANANDGVAQTTPSAVFTNTYNEYTVTYLPGAHGTFPETSTGALHYGDNTPIAPSTPGDVEWSFTGWSPARASTVTGSAIYTAQWSQNEYRVTYDPNGGTGGPADGALYRYNDPVSVKFTPAPVKGYSMFLGWAHVASETTPAYTDTGVSSFPITGNTTLYAVYSPDSHTVTYFSEGHTSGIIPAPTTHAHGSVAMVNDSGTLVREHYTFMGWDTSPLAKAVVYSQGVQLTVTDDVNLYAVWKEIAKYRFF